MQRQERPLGGGREGEAAANVAEGKVTLCVDLSEAGCKAETLGKVLLPFYYWLLQNELG